MEKEKMKSGRGLGVALLVGGLAIWGYWLMTRNRQQSLDPWTGRYISLSSLSPVDVQISKVEDKYVLTGARHAGKPWGQNVTGTFDPVSLRVAGEFHYNPSGVSKFTGSWNDARERFELIDDQGDARIGFFLYRDHGQFALAHPVPKCLSGLRPMVVTEEQTEDIGEVWGVYTAQMNGKDLLAKLENELGKGTRLLPNEETYTWDAEGRSEYDSFPLNFELLIDQRAVVEGGKLEFKPAKDWIIFVDYKLGGETRRRIE